jgi:hypothetical protein
MGLRRLKGSQRYDCKISFYKSTNIISVSEDRMDKIKNGKLLTSHRSTIYPCYLPILGEFNRSWSYKTCRGKYTTIAVNEFLIRG